MTVVATPTALAAAVLLKNGQAGADLADAALDAANGNALAGLDNNSLIVFRTTAVGAATITVYADVNGLETAIDTITVQGNGTAGGVHFYRPPRDVNWQNHNTSCPTFTGSLVFKSSTANCNAKGHTQAQT
jgi:hypothetical protein